MDRHWSVDGCTLYDSPDRSGDLDGVGHKDAEVSAVALDARGIPTAGCPNCGEQWLKVPMIFDDETYDIAAWGLEGECFSCGTLVTVCTPVDQEAESL